MNTYKRHRFPPDIISYAVWLYYRFNLRRVVTATAGVPDHSDQRQAALSVAYRGPGEPAPRSALGMEM